MQDRALRGHYGHPLHMRVNAYPSLSQVSHYAFGGCQPEGALPAEEDGVSLLYQDVRL